MISAVVIQGLCDQSSVFWRDVVQYKFLDSSSNGKFIVAYCVFGVGDGGAARAQQGMASG